ncbi:MAG: hypothetical protein A2Z96_00690 [Spirochaetes bacterium GWB1_48_6]|nr:MAG: hypothetical protein A2Z96_00690 [Spirochaetes bacterium GWB1_48_6]
MIQSLVSSELLVAIFLDLTISGAWGGVVLCQEIRKIRGMIPIFVVSGYSQDPEMIQPQDYGFPASLGKPFGMGELVSLLNIYLK